jgi:hypothetical protein
MAKRMKTANAPVPRDVLDMLDELGLELLETRFSRHLCLRLKNRHGIIGTIPVSGSPRNAANVHKHRKKQFRRFAEMTEQPTGPF